MRHQGEQALHGRPGTELNSAEFRAAVTRVPDAAGVLRLIDAFYDPLIDRGATRQPPARDDTITAEAA